MQHSLEYFLLCLYTLDSRKLIPELDTACCFSQIQRIVERTINTIICEYFSLLGVYYTSFHWSILLIGTFSHASRNAYYPYNLIPTAMLRCNKTNTTWFYLKKNRAHYFPLVLVTRLSSLTRLLSVALGNKYAIFSH